MGPTDFNGTLTAASEKEVDVLNGHIESGLSGLSHSTVYINSLPTPLLLYKSVNRITVTSVVVQNLDPRQVTKSESSVSPIGFPMEHHQWSVQLYNGIAMPILGLGTTHNGGYNHESVVYALKDCGYRLVDTAKRYGTEAFIKEAILDSGVPREDIFLTSKLWPADYGQAKVLPAFQGSLERLGTDYLDLYLLHWPEVPTGIPDRRRCLDETWRALELLVESGKCRAIGVSNFLEHHLDSLIENASIIPHVNQCEFHPYQNPLSLRHYCQELGIQFEGYCPLAKGRILDDPVVVQVSQKNGKTPAQVLLRWSIQNGVVTIPKSTKLSRVRENFEVQKESCKLSEDQMAVLNSLHSDLKVSWDPSTVPRY
ncbi:uncharacterized oxidoreductase ZK1290.5-like isoform X2 [Tigriopus californicus]|uniref:uncharacterized oxidoreductase ZK1290.5-like isoform X2 n=1 Tax=Tigriopus californicus TaxID=6832 RepID=UPI0027DA3466|nr:uncharacterized oxidoreductase ZK1290.5-like isoform X2 [Tigriopus californicus]